MLTIRFWKSPTCTKCHQVLPKLKAYAEDRGVTLEVLDAEEHPAAAAHDGVMGFPTILALCDKDVLARLEPNATWAAMRKLVDDVEAGDL